MADSKLKYRNWKQRLRWTEVVGVGIGFFFELLFWVLKTGNDDLEREGNELKENAKIRVVLCGNIDVCVCAKGRNCFGELDRGLSTGNVYLLNLF